MGAMEFLASCCIVGRVQNAAVALFDEEFSDFL